MFMNSYSVWHLLLKTFLYLFYKNHATSWKWVVFSSSDRDSTTKCLLTYSLNDRYCPCYQPDIIFVIFLWIPTFQLKKWNFSLWFQTQFEKFNLEDSLEKLTQNDSNTVCFRDLMLPRLDVRKTDSQRQTLLPSCCVNHDAPTGPLIPRNPALILYSQNYICPS